MYISVMVKIIIKYPKSNLPGCCSTAPPVTIIGNAIITITIIKSNNILFMIGIFLYVYSFLNSKT
jgi:hypothetical protein